MHRNRSVDAHRFAMIPRADVPRSSFNTQKTYKTTFDSGYLIPILVDEVLPGDSWNCRMTAFSRLTTPIFPIMDNLHMDTFFFFVPNRLVYEHWQKLMGERWPDPNSSIDYLVPMMTCPPGGYPVNSIYDYMGLPTVGQIPVGAQVEHSALPLRAYNLIFSEWFRDQNLQDSPPLNRGEGPDNPADYQLRRRGKRHDYFTSCLPWPQKGDSVLLPIGGQAPIKSTGVAFAVRGATSPVNGPWGTAQHMALENTTNYNVVLGGATYTNPASLTFGSPNEVVHSLYTDLSVATAATVNQLRQAFQIQRLLERDARGGTRYTEIIRSHFGVTSPDARLQRPEYLGGGSTMININPIAQNSATGATGTTSPLGTLAAIGTNLINGHGFNASFTEHGIIIGLVMVRADLTYQQGLHKMWSRKTRYDFYFPAFAHLGEQAVLNKEIYVQGNSQDNEVFGYQERWAEYRYKPSQITGRFRSTSQGTLDGWHLSQRFNTLPALNSDFIEERPPVQRILAVGPEALGSEFYFDAFFDIKMARPMPMYSVPGLIDHF